MAVFSEVATKEEVINSMISMFNEQGFVGALQRNNPEKQAEYAVYLLGLLKQVNELWAMMPAKRKELIKEIGEESFKNYKSNCKTFLRARKSSERLVKSKLGRRELGICPAYSRPEQVFNELIGERAMKDLPVDSLMRMLPWLVVYATQDINRLDSNYKRKLVCFVARVYAHVSKEVGVKLKSKKGLKVVLQRVDNSNKVPFLGTSRDFSELQKARDGFVDKVRTQIQNKKDAAAQTTGDRKVFDTAIANYERIQREVEVLVDRQMARGVESKAFTRALNDCKDELFADVGTLNSTLNRLLDIIQRESFTASSVEESQRNMFEEHESVMESVRPKVESEGESEVSKESIPKFKASQQAQREKEGEKHGS